MPKGASTCSKQDDRGHVDALPMAETLLSSVCRPSSPRPGSLAATPYTS